jgi:hypothetical protein
MRVGGLRDRIIIGAILTAVWAVAGAELLSLVKWLSFWPLLIWWSVPVLCGVGTLIIRRKLRPPQFTLNPPRDWVLTAICIAVALILATTFVVAVVTPPNNGDSLGYHLPRQVHWMQQGHVGFYPAANLRHIVMPPLAEYMGVQLMILSGGDRLLNLIQWLALGLSALTASAIARDLGCNARLQALAALLVVTVPIAALEAVNTKNDVVSGFCLLAAAFFALKQYLSARPAPGVAPPEPSRPSGHRSLPFLIGASLGLLVLSKASGALLACSVAVWVGIVLLRSYHWPRTLAYGLVVATMALAINAGHFLRVHNEFGSPVWVPERIQLSPKQMAELSGNPAMKHQRLMVRWGTLTNKKRSPNAVLSNVIRNTTMHLATGIPAIDNAILRMVTMTHKWLGIGLNDPRTTYAGSWQFDIKPWFTHESLARAPIHVLLGFFLLPMIVAAIRRKSDPWIVALMCTPYLGLFLFSYFLAWQQWHPRLHIPLLFSLCPFIVYGLGMRFEKVLYVAAAIALLLTGYAVTFNPHKPIVGESNIFTSSREQLRLRPAQAQDFFDQLRLIHRTLKPKVVGILGPGPEYNFLVAFLDSDLPPPTLVHLDPQFVPRRGSSQTQLVPDVVIGRARPYRPKEMKFTQREYVLADKDSSLAVYFPAHESLPPGQDLWKEYTVKTVQQLGNEWRKTRELRLAPLPPATNEIKATETEQ